MSLPNLVRMHLNAWLDRQAPLPNVRPDVLHREATALHTYYQQQARNLETIRSRDQSRWAYFHQQMLWHQDRATRLADLVGAA